MMNDIRLNKEKLPQKFFSKSFFENFPKHVLIHSAEIFLEKLFSYIRKLDKIYISFLTH